MEPQKRTPKRPSKIEDMSKEQIRQAILKKRECNKQAQTIVESLLEKGISNEFFLKCVPNINQSHLEDIIEERAIMQLCGYPVCSNSITEKDIPKQQYRISMKTNKVYDITARKSFCSNKCYKSAMYIKKQMLTSPLWFREYEQVPTFNLMPVDASGSMGQEIDVSLVEKIEVEKKSLFTSINDFATASLKDVAPENDGGSNSGETNKKEITEQSCQVESDDKRGEIPGNTKEDQSKEQTINKQQKQTKTPNPLNIVGEIVEKPERKIDSILTDTPKSLNKENINKKVAQKKQHSTTAIIIEVEKCLAEWFTLDTLLFLFGEEKVKEMVADKGECIKEYLNNYAKSISYNSHTYDQYQALCRKLNLLELEERKVDNEILQRELKPLPDYSILKEESKRMQLKVNSFLSGQTDIPVDETREVTECSGTDDDNLTQLPLVDKNAQSALRRRIVCQHLNKFLPDLLRSLGLLTLSISSDVRLLVSTLKLRADNIMFKPIQWTLIAMVIIKLLSLRDQRLHYLLDEPTTYQHMQLLLLSYKQDGGYFDRLISWLTDIDRLLSTDDTQLTIE